VGSETHCVKAASTITARKDGLREKRKRSSILAVNAHIAVTATTMQQCNFITLATKIILGINYA
jgi:hypothetical protein